MIALVDDDRNILTSVSIALQAEGFVTRVYSDGETALKALIDNPPDLGVFDIKMPRMDGLELLRRLRENSAIPVIFLTSKDDELDEALGLAMGADDYIAKPFSQRLLIARIRAILRRHRTGAAARPPRRRRSRAADRSSAAAWRWTRRATASRWDGKDVTLTVTEFLILEALAQRPGVVKTRNQLMDAAYQRRHLCRRPHDRQPHQAPAPQVPQRRPRVRRDRDALWRRLPLRRAVTSADLALRWSGRWSLTPPHPRGQHLRASLLVALSMLYLDVFRNRLIKERTQQTRIATRDRGRGAAPRRRQRNGRRCSRPCRRSTGARLRLYGRDGTLLVDSWQLTGPTYELRDPRTQTWTKDVARALDRGLQRHRRRPAARRLSPSRRSTGSQAWPEAVAARAARQRSATEVRTRPTARRSSPPPRRFDGGVLLTTDNARDFTRDRPRAAGAASLGAMAAVIAALGPAVAVPRADDRPAAAPARARRAPRAARPRARGGRAAPALAPRRDRPARPRALRHEPGAAAADRRDRSVRRRRHPRAQEPARLAALRGRRARPGRGSRASRSGCWRSSATTSRRLDRLITDISEASRIDAELARATFEPVDLGPLIEQLVAQLGDAPRDRRRADRLRPAAQGHARS